MKNRKLSVLILLVTFISSAMWAKDHKLAPDLSTDSSSDQVNVIVQFKHTPGEVHKDKIRSKGGSVDSDLSLVKGVSGKLPKNRLQELANDPDVAYISPDRPVQGTNDGNPSATLDYHYTTVNAQIAWQLGYDGTGIGVAVIDSGIIDIPDLHSQKGYRVVYSQDFVNGGSAVDKYGHGSHVAGIVGGNGNKSTGSNYSYTFKGIAPNVNLVNLRVLDQNGVGTDSQVIAAINQAINLKSKYNIQVINLSLGRPVYESYKLDPLCQAVEQAWKAGIVVVVAAGNDGRDNSAGTNGYATITAPGNDPL